MTACPSVCVHIHPQTQRWDTSGIFLSHNWYRVVPRMVLLGDLFQVCTSAARHLPQKILGMPDLFSIAVILLLSNQFAHSATPFCCRQFRTVGWWEIPHDIMNWLNSFEVYSPPLLSCRAFMWCPVWFSAYTLKFLKVWRTSDFLFMYHE